MEHLLRRFCKYHGYLESLFDTIADLFYFRSSQKKLGLYYLALLNLGHFFYSRPKVKSPPQDILLKLQQEHTLKEESEASSMFVFKLGLAKLKCSFLMNGLVFDSVEVLLDEWPHILVAFRKHMSNSP